MIKTDYVLVEGELGRIKKNAKKIEANYDVTITKKPEIGLTMLKAQDSVEHQEFFLGEALSIECEVALDKTVEGIGICLGDEPERAYFIALFDAALKIENNLKLELLQFIEEEYLDILKKEKTENHHILKTKVDFNLMD